jgi:hypothetical protein
VALCDERSELQRLRWRATTAAYEQAAIDTLLDEVNQIALELELPERLPITRSDLIETRISTPFWAESTGQFGFVSTSNYYYYANAANKLSSIVPNFGTDDIRRPAYLDSLRKRYLLPKAQMDTNAAYAMATQWLAKAGMNVEALERDAEKVDVSAWVIGNRFVPIYVVRWQRLGLYRGDQGPPEFESIGAVNLVAPERRLLQMDMDRARDIKRKPLAVPDRDRLLQQADDPRLRELWFTTEAYKAAALEVALKEVNWAAHALTLPEHLPIRSSDLASTTIGTPYVADHGGAFAIITTSNYTYQARAKLASVRRTYLDPGDERHRLALIRTRYTTALSQANSNLVYSLAARWLMALSVDLNRLEAEYPHRISVSWCFGDRFVPLYTVEWSKPIERSSRRDVAASIELLEPERSLEHLVIEKPEYITRPPLVVPDRDKLLKPTSKKP